jgi:hypothetical protein
MVFFCIIIQKHALASLQRARIAMSHTHIGEELSASSLVIHSMMCDNVCDYLRNFKDLSSWEAEANEQRIRKIFKSLQKRSTVG